MKAYIVDDDTITIMLVANILVNADIDVKYSLHTDKNILQKMLEYKPDVIILDIYMEDKNGIDLAKEIKRNPMLKDTPLVALSGSTDNVDKVKAMLSGFIDFVEKPFEREDFISKIRKYGLIGHLMSLCTNKILEKIC